jgi:hypothetical protein
MTSLWSFRYLKNKPINFKMTYYYCRKRSEGEKDRERAKTFKLSDGQTGMSEEVGEGD